MRAKSLAVVLACAAPILAAGALFAVPVGAARVHALRFQFALEDLNSGRVTAGMQIPDSWFNEAKPHAQVYYSAPDGRSFGLWGYTHRHGALHVYSCDGTLFAAHYVQGIRTSEDRWFFCNPTLLADYLTLASPPPSAPVPQGSGG